MGSPERPRPDIAVIDYGMGTRVRMRNALRNVGAEPTITDEAETIAAADGLVIPGVGAFPVAMEALHERDLIGPLEEFRASGKPMLGVCLGEQLMFEASTEHGYTEGLGWLPGIVELVPGNNGAVNMGPRLVTWQRESPLSEGVGESIFYHVHANAVCETDPEIVLGTSSVNLNAPPELRFVTAVHKGNLYGTQFHPEISWEDGKRMVTNFVEMCRRDDR